MQEKKVNSFLTLGDWLVEKYISVRKSTVNRLAWLVVICGIALVAEPYWQPYLSAFVEKEFGLDVNSSSAPWIGIPLILLGLGYHLLHRRIQNGEQSSTISKHREHDTSILSNLVKTQPFSRIRETIQWIGDNHAFFNHDRDALNAHLHFLQATENEFLDEKLRNAAEEYSYALNEMLNFLFQSFFVYPDFEIKPNGYQFCMYPDLNSDRRGGGFEEEDIKYRAYSDELNTHLDRVLSTQDQLIRCTKVLLGSALSER